MKEVLLATMNPAKQAHLTLLLRDLPVEVHTPDEFGLQDYSVREEGWTFQDNAEHKARAFAKAADMAALASDGGLEIPALRGRWEGLKSRRFAGPEDEDRITALLAMMKDLPPQSRSARFHEAVALSEPDGRLIASVQKAGPIGRIAERPDPRSRPGFWVPTLWLYPPRWVSEWDLTDEERDHIRTAWDAVDEALHPRLTAWAEEHPAPNE